MPESAAAHDATPLPSPPWDEGEDSYSLFSQILQEAAAHDATPPPSPPWDEGEDPYSLFSQIPREDMREIRNFVYQSRQGDDNGRDELTGTPAFEDRPRLFIVRPGWLVGPTVRYERVELVPQPEEEPSAVPYGRLKKTAIEADEEENACAVCLEDMEVGSEACSLECKHKFHEACIVQWLEKKLSCPLCRCRV